MNKKKIFKIIFFSLFLAFVISYIIQKTGYYEYNLQNKMVMTNEAMKQFEQDIKEGKDVRREDYLVSTEKDYTSTLTKGTNKVSIKVNSILKKGIEGVFKVIGSFVEDQPFEHQISQGISKPKVLLINNNIIVSKVRLIYLAFFILTCIYYHVIIDDKTMIKELLFY